MGIEIEDAFKSTSKIIFGKELAGIQNYEAWLLENVRKNFSQESALSGKTIIAANVVVFANTKKRMVTLTEALEAGKKQLPLADAKKLDAHNASKLLEPIKYYGPDAIVGDNIGMEECAQYGYSRYCYRSSTIAYGKYCGYCFWPREADHTFGCDTAIASKFSMKCYNSINLSRCFEVSHSTDCSDCYFCHNVENCQECMFCFNVKAKRYAIGNVEYPKEEYLRIKKLVLAEIAAKLEKNKKLELSIFNLGCKI